MVLEDRNARNVQVREAGPDRCVSVKSPAGRHKALLDPDKTGVGHGEIARRHHRVGWRLATGLIGDVVQYGCHCHAAEADRCGAVRGVPGRAAAGVDVLAFECTVAGRKAVDAAIARRVGAVVESIKERVRIQRIGAVQAVEQPGDTLAGDRISVVHAGFQQRYFALGGLQNRFAEGQWDWHHPICQVKLAVLDARCDDRAVEAAAVPGKSALNHRLSLHGNGHLIQATGCPLRVAPHVEQRWGRKVDLNEQTPDESASNDGIQFVIQTARRRYAYTWDRHLRSPTGQRYVASAYRAGFRQSLCSERRRFHRGKRSSYRRTDRPRSSRRRRNPSRQNRMAAQAWRAG